MSDEIKSPDVAGFWRWFAEHSDDLLAIVRGERQGRVTSLIDRALEEDGLHLVYEVTADADGAELTFTPLGDPESAELIDRVVACAPRFEGWRIFSRRQRRALPTALDLVKLLYAVDLSNARLKVTPRRGRFHVEFVHPALAALDDDERVAVAGTFFDYALGEQVTMDFVDEPTFAARGDAIDMGLAVNQLIRETSAASGS